MNLSFKSAFQSFLFLLVWFSLILQFVIRKDSVGNFFSYFTILSNLLFGIYLLFLAVFKNTRGAAYFSRPNVLSAITLYMIIVGLVYNLVLRGIWNPQGWQLVADNLLHVVNPLLSAVYWVVFLKRGMLTYKGMLNWLIFPLLYLIYSLVRGHFNNWYPYPFLNVTKFGYSQVLINASFVVIAFLLFSVLLIQLDRVLKKLA
ncbi:MAG: hypothetical protein EOO90_11730 [Pedobacter sp.]|nr:MAG: hypothetical protein EOO90_11730 [Pedobacter sp.]